MKLQYPKVIFYSEPSGLRVTIGLATQLKALRSKHKLLDMTIDCPNKRYHGIRIDFKAESPYKKDNSLVADKLIKSQYETMLEYDSLGFLALFIWKFDDFKELLDYYMKDDSLGVSQTKVLTLFNSVPWQ